MKHLRVAAFLIVLLPALSANAGIEEGRNAFLKSNYATAWKELRPLAKSGAAEAQYLLGVMYSHGAGIKRDFEKSARWYETAAKQGHAEAAFNLGFMLYRDEKPTAAAPWLVMAAERGNAEAQYLVGLMYREGLGVAKDDERADKWIRDAADKGVAGAQYEAGLTCARRIGRLGCTPVEAYKWFRLLADAGYPGAAANANRLAATMAASEIAEGDRLARAWRPRP